MAARDYDVLAPAPLAGVDRRLIDILTLGHRGFYDDVVNIWTLQALADERLKTKTPAEIQKAMLLAVDSHPRVESLYMLACFVLALDFSAPEACESISLVGLKALPDSWRVPVTQGFISHFKMGDPKKAAAYYQLAASRPGAPEYLQSLARKLAEKGQLSEAELKQTVDGLLDVPGGSKFGQFLKGPKP